MKKLSAGNKIVFSLVLSLLLAGCGLKGNPVPSASVVSTSQGEQKLSVSADGNAIVLIWQMQNPDGKISYINIEKSELGSAGNICRDCPRTFEKIGQIQILNVKNENNDYKFSDPNVEKGKIYSYRLNLCDEAGVCHQSKTVEVDFK